MDNIQVVTSIFFEDSIEELIDSIRTAYPEVITYKNSKSINEHQSTNYIVFHPGTETIVPTRVKMIEFDGYICDVVCIRTMVVNARIYYENLVDVEKMISAVLAAAYVTCKAKNSTVTWVTQEENDAINNQGELAILTFEMDLPVLKAINNVAPLTYLSQNFAYGDPPEPEQTVYNPLLEIPPKFNIT